MNAVASRNIKFISHCDQGGRGDGVQIMVHRGFAYIGHGFSNGITVVDVRDPKHPKTVNFIACPPNTRAHHLQTHGDLLLAVNGPSVWTMQINEKAYFSGSSAEAMKEKEFTTGLRVYDLSKPEAPREIAFMPTDGLGPHRIWYVGGRYAISRSTSPTSAIMCWRSSTWQTRPGPTWSASTGCRACGRAAARPRLGPRAGVTRCITGWSPATSLYSAWRDGGLAVIDVADPTKPKLVCHRNWDPPFGGGTHSPLPLPDRNLLVVADEANFANCSMGLRYIWIFDVREPSNPISISTVPDPGRGGLLRQGRQLRPAQSVGKPARADCRART